MTTETQTPPQTPLDWICPKCGEQDLWYMADAHECWTDRIERERASAGVEGSSL